MNFANFQLEYFSLRHNLSPATARLHRQTFRELGWLEGVDMHSITRWCSSLSENRGENTARKLIRTAKTICSWAIKCQYLTANPFIGVPSAPIETDSDWFYVGQSLCGQLTTELPRLLALRVGLCRLAGLRLGEAERVEQSDVKLASPATLTVANVGARTTKRRKRVVPVCPSLVKLLVESNHDPLCDPMKNANRSLRTHLNMLGIPTWEKLFHTLRKNCETDWLAKHPVMDVCRWMGHSAQVSSSHYHQTRPQVLLQVSGADPWE